MKQTKVVPVLVAISALMIVLIIFFSVFGERNYNADEYIKLGDYKGLKISVSKSNENQDKSFDDILSDYYNGSDKENNVISESEIKDTLWEMVNNNCEVISYPEQRLSEIKSNFQNDVRKKVTEAGSDFNTYILTTYGMSETEFDEYVQDLAENVLKQELIIKAIAKKENLRISNEEYQNGVSKYIELYSTEDSPYTEKMLLEDYNGKDGFKQQLLLEKIIELIEKNCVINYV